MIYQQKHFHYQPPTHHLNRVALHSLLKPLIEKFQRFQRTVCSEVELEPILGMEGYSELYVFDPSGLAMHIYPADDHKTICLKYRPDTHLLTLLPKLFTIIEEAGWVEIDDPCETTEIS